MIFLGPDKLTLCFMIFLVSNVLQNDISEFFRGNLHHMLHYFRIFYICLHVPNDQLADIFGLQ